MIELENTGDTVVMLLVAAGVGLIGGIGAAFIEWRRGIAAPTEVSQATAKHPIWSVASCVVLGGIAAVAVLYFFPPTEEVVEGGKSTTSYDLTELVALALIVGSAGAAFLQALQTRALALASAERTKATEATATEALNGVADQAAKATEAGIAAASTQIKAELQKASSLEPSEADAIVGRLATMASTTVAQNLGSQVATAQRMVAAAANGETTGDVATNEPAPVVGSEPVSGPA